MHVPKKGNQKTKPIHAHGQPNVIRDTHKRYESNGQSNAINRNVNESDETNTLKIGAKTMK